MVLPSGEVAQVPIAVPHSAADAKAAKDAAIERGDLSLGHTLPAMFALLRKKEGTGGGHELVDVDEPGRLVPVQETVAKEVEYLMEHGHVRIFHGMHRCRYRVHMARGGGCTPGSAARQHHSITLGLLHYSYTTVTLRGLQGYRARARPAISAGVGLRHKPLSVRL